MLTALVVPLVAFVDVRPGAIRSVVPRQSTASPICMQGPAGSLNRREALASSLALLSAVPVAPALAESTLVTRQQAYTRYVPRIERGRDYWSTALRSAVDRGDWAKIAEAVEKKGSIDRIFGPMELWASSWSGKTISDKTLSMNAAIDELREAAAALRTASKGEEGGGGGLFGFLGGAKKLEDGKRKEIAQAAYKKGVTAINNYIEIGNDSLGLQFSPIDTID